jgi:hypothetical protein
VYRKQSYFFLQKIFYRAIKYLQVFAQYRNEKRCIPGQCRPTRRQIIGLLAEQPLNMNAVAEQFTASRLAASPLL